MSHKPTIAYRTLKVHGPAPVADSGAERGAQRPGFSELMRRRPTAATGLAAPVGLLRVDSACRDAEVVRADTEVDVETDTRQDPGRAGANASPGETVEAYLAREIAARGGSPESLGTGPLGGAAAPQLDAALGDRMVAYLAATVTRFCNDPAVRDGDGWQIRIELREDVLPGTTLHLSLSLQWLQLRFETIDERSRNLLLRHRDTLETTLDKALVPGRDISITCH